MIKVDLSQLAVDRGETPRPKTSPVGRRWVSRYVLPLFIVVAFFGLLGWAAKDSLLPYKSVTVVPVVVARAEVQQADTPLFQAAGWIEPRPAPLVVSSLSPGVIDELLVVEGQSIAKGEPIARLLDTDTRIALNEAKAELSLREADVEAAQAELESAKLAMDNPVKLQADLADADAALARIEAELHSIPAATQAAQTRRELAERNVEKKRQAGSAVAGRVLRDAEAELASAIAASDQLGVRTPILKEQRDALQRKRDAVREQLSLKLDHRRRLAISQAALKAAEARMLRAKLAVEATQLQLSRMTISSPINGRVLALQATPGKRVVGIDPHSEQGSSAIVTLYDPQMLQVRVDVRLEDVPQVQLGQNARIETASAADGLAGKVISVTSRADVQKNTLQVKVAITNPPDVIRPEMLGQVTFLAPELPGKEKDESEESLRVLIPRQLVSTTEGGSHVWVADQHTNTARRQSVTLGRAGTDELVEVASGLTPTDKIISGGTERLQDGDRIRVAGEDSMLGLR